MNDEFGIQVEGNEGPDRLTSAQNQLVSSSSRVMILTDDKSPSVTTPHLQISVDFVAATGAEIATRQQWRTGYK
jgi:hypothetical protein